MRRFTSAPAVIIGLTAIGLIAALAAPTRIRAAGLDFWNFAHERNVLRDAAVQADELDFDLEQTRRRDAAGASIAAALCDDRIALPEAIEGVAALADHDPVWFGQLWVHYCQSGDLSPTATDRDVLAHFLRAKIAALIWAAEALDEGPRAAFLSARLAHFDKDVGEPVHSVPAPHANR